MNNIDINQLRMERRRIDAQIHLCKSALRMRWTRPMVAEQRELLALRHEATELCILRAWLRGNQHLADPERCRETAQRRAQDFQREVGAPAFSASCARGA
jgi:hypothetical protein